MSYLIDTNVISELTKNKPNKKVVDWFKGTPDHELHISVITLGEIRKGVIRINDDKKKEKIRSWLDHELVDWFRDRILPIDAQVANKWGVLQASLDRTLPAIDSLIAATAMHSDLILVTRNTKDFAITGMEVINPFV